MIDATNWSGKQMIEWLFNESEEFEHIRFKAQTDSDLTLETFLSKVESGVMPLDEFYSKFKYAFNMGIQISKNELRVGTMTHERIIFVVFESFLETTATHLIIKSMANQTVDALEENLKSKGLTLDDIDVNTINIMSVDEFIDSNDNLSNMTRYN